MKLRTILIRILSIVATTNLFGVGLAVFVYRTIHYKADRAVAVAELDAVFQMNRIELVGNLMLNHHELLQEQIAAIESRYGIKIQLDSLYYRLQSISKDDREPQYFSKSYLLNYGNRDYGQATLSIKNHFHLVNYSMLGAWILLQVLTLSGMMGLIYRWALRSMIEPLELLLQKGGNRIQQGIEFKGQWIPWELHRFAALLGRLWDEYGKKCQEATLVAVSRQVAHDIRSPLLALETLSNDYTHALSFERKIVFTTAVNRIRSITQDLLKPISNKHIAKVLDESEAPQTLHHMITSMIEEKQISFKSQTKFQMISDSCQPAPTHPFYCNISNETFKRILSNILDNSIEAGANQIRVHLEISSNVGKIKLCDNGKGIPQIVISQLGQIGFSYDKPDGSGLGLNYAFQQIQLSGGSMKIQSQEGMGTTVLIQIPQSGS